MKTNARGHLHGDRDGHYPVDGDAERRPPPLDDTPWLRGPAVASSIALSIERVSDHVTNDLR
jgi:hypothetical protein